MLKYVHVPSHCLKESNSLQVSFTLNEELTMIEGLEKKTVSAPREHNFTMQSVGGQTLTVFTENSSGDFSVFFCNHIHSAVVTGFSCELSICARAQRSFLWFGWWKLQSHCFLLYSSLSSCTFSAHMCTAYNEIVQIFLQK